MQIADRQNRKVNHLDLREARGYDCCCTTWPVRAGTVDFLGEKVYFIEYQQLAFPEKGQEFSVRIMGYSISENRPDEKTDFVSIEERDVNALERSRLREIIREPGSHLLDQFRGFEKRVLRDSQKGILSGAGIISF